MGHTHILVVDDEPDLLELVHYNLTRGGYEVKCVKSGEEALAYSQTHIPDLIILDVMLPGIDGLETCKRLRQDVRTGTLPILMLTARSEEADMVAGLELGADDYLPKPFSPRVLLARVKAVLRRQHGAIDDREAQLMYGSVSIHPGHHEVRAGGQPVRLTPTEFRILLLLTQRPGWVFSRYQIVDSARGEEAGVTERSVDVHIAALRRKLGIHGRSIETVRGVGYRLRTGL